MEGCFTVHQRAVQHFCLDYIASLIGFQGGGGGSRIGAARSDCILKVFQDIIVVLLIVSGNGAVKGKNEFIFPRNRVKATPFAGELLVEFDIGLAIAKINVTGFHMRKVIQICR